jgi:hypothetical protein
VAGVGAVVLLAGIVAGLARQDPPEAPGGGPSRTQVLDFEDVSPPQLPPFRVPLNPPPPPAPEHPLRFLDRTDLGISFAIPAQMEVHANDPAGAVFLAIERPGARGIAGWLRIFLLPGTEGVAVTAQRVTAELLTGRQGVRDLVSNPTLVATRPAWYLRFKLPLNADGTGPVIDQTYYFLQLDRGVAALASGSLEGQPAPVEVAVATLRFI